MAGRSRVRLRGHVALIVGVAGLVASVVGFIADPARAYFSWLTAFAAGLSVALGALALVLMSNVIVAKWFVVLRRLAECAASTLPLFALLFIPVLAGMHHLYPWVPPLHVTGADTLRRIHAKAAYLNVSFFVVRAVVYFAVWATLSWILRRWSLARDADAGPVHRGRRGLSAAGLVALALTMTFASFDWLMSLAPAWYSTVFGVYYFAGGFLAAMGLVALLALIVRGKPLGEMITPEHEHALGKLTLTFVIFWAYIAFSQYLIIWIADIPIEASWYVTRTSGGWGTLALTVGVGEFAIPFLVLLTRSAKRSTNIMAALGLWILVFHYLDTYWLVMPALDPGHVRVSWWDLSALCGVGGLAVAFGRWQLRGHAVVPVGDPALEMSLRYRAF